MKFLKFTEYKTETIYPASRLAFVQLSNRDVLNPKTTTITFQFHFDEIGGIEIESTREYRDLCKCRDLIVQYLNSTSPDIIDVNWIFANYTGREID